MPVSYLPCYLPLLLVTVPLLCLYGGRRLFRNSLIVSVGILVAVVLIFYLPGWIWMPRANRGDPEAKYKLARWTENHCENIGSVIFWPCQSDVLGGFAWLERAAAQDYPPALYLVGVRMKYGQHVPMPSGWNGPSGNVFPQPERGQKLIDPAIELGFVPPGGDERAYYRQHFR